MTSHDPKAGGSSPSPLVKQTLDKDLSKIVSLEQGVRPTAHRLGAIGLALCFLVVAGGFATSPQSR